MTTRGSRRLHLIPEWLIFLDRCYTGRLKPATEVVSEELLFVPIGLQTSGLGASP